VRACDEVQGTLALTIDGRGFDSKVAAGAGVSFMESDCVSCGACVQACPTATLQEKTVVELGMPTRSVITTCAYCGVGCSFKAELRGDELVRMVPYKDGGANEGHSCVKGRFAIGYATMAKHLTATGAFYGYIAHGLGRIVGMASGLLITMAYVVFEGSLIGIFSFFFQNLMNSLFGVHVHWVLPALLMLVLNSILAFYDINIAAKVLGVFLITEIVMLSLGALAVLFHGGGPNGFAVSETINPLGTFQPAAGIVIDYPGQLDWRVLLLSVVICIGSTMLFALMPAIQSSHVDLSGALKSEGAGVVGGSGRSRLRSALVLVQVSLSFVLLAGTGLLLQSLQRMQNTSPGFFTNNVMVAVVDLFSAGYKLDRAKIFHTQLLDRVRALPGVESAALTRVMPFSYNPPSSAPIEIDGYQSAPDEQPNADYVQVSEDYFSTLGIPLVAGREFTRNDDENSPRVAIINETMAAKYWPGKDPLGQRLKVKDTWMQIVGVAKNVYYETKLEAPRSFFYVPVRQNFFVGNTLLIRTRESPGAITNALSREVHALDPTLAPYAADRLQEQVDQRGYTQRLAVTLLAIFGGMALFLATIGLYAVMSYSVSQRTHELGLRMALGADAGNLLRLVLSHGLRLTTAGILVGTIAAFVLTRLMGNLLYKVSPRDPLAFGSALVVITLASLAACFLPAWRATRVDPVQALREQ